MQPGTCYFMSHRVLLLASLVLSSASYAMASPSSIFDFSVPTLNRGDIDMASMRGKSAYLLVNVASK